MPELEAKVADNLQKEANLQKNLSLFLRNSAPPWTEIRVAITSSAVVGKAWASRLEATAYGIPVERRRWRPSELLLYLGVRGWLRVWSLLRQCRVPLPTHPPILFRRSLLVPMQATDGTGMASRLSHVSLRTQQRCRPLFVNRCLLSQIASSTALWC